MVCTNNRYFRDLVAVASFSESPKQLARGAYDNGCSRPPVADTRDSTYPNTPLSQSAMAAILRWSLAVGMGLLLPDYRLSQEPGVAYRVPLRTLEVPSFEPR